MEPDILYIDDTAAILDNFYFPKEDSLYDLGLKIKEKSAKTICINAHFYFTPEKAPEKYDYLQSCAGIDLLKMLRLLGERRHCILYSPLTEVELLQLDPRNLIITSKGVTCIQSINQLQNLKLDKLAGVISPLPFPKEYFKVDFQMPEDERHNWANWWGIKQLCDVHKLIDPQIIVKDNFYFYGGKEFITLNNQLKSLKSQEVIYLYGHKEREIRKAIFDYELIKLRDEKEEKTVELQQLNEEIVQLDLKKLQLVAASAVYKKNEHEKKEWQQLITESLTAKENIDCKIKLLESQSNNLESPDENFMEKLELIRSKLSKDVKIIFIDDQANEGWSDIFSYMLFGEYKLNSDQFLAISPKISELENIELYYQQCIKGLLRDKDLVLLDLRLGKETSVGQNINNLSGVILLEKIRKDFPGLPIMMVTASNKFKSFEQLKRNGGDAIWSKEGLDKGSGEYKAVSNYVKFIELVNTLTSQDYLFLKDISFQIKSLSTKNYWWGKGKVKKSILKILDDSILLFRNFCIQKTEKNQYFTHKTHWFYPSLIIQNTAKILETIKPERNRTFQVLWFVRNWASHSELTETKVKKNITQLNIFIAKNFLRVMINYLKNKNYVLASHTAKKYFQI